MSYSKKDLYEKNIVQIMKTTWDFEIKTNHLIPLKRFKLEVTNHKKQTYQLVDFTVPVYYKVKVKESCTIFTINAMCEIDI